MDEETEALKGELTGAKGCDLTSTHHAAFQENLETRYLGGQCLWPGMTLGQLASEVKPHPPNRFACCLTVYSCCSKTLLKPTHLLLFLALGQ